MHLELQSTLREPPVVPGIERETFAKPDRRWGAVLTADVVEYTRLTSQNEERTYFRYKSHRRELIDPTITLYRARFSKSTGDGIMAEFAIALDAARCAVAVQQSMVERCRYEASNSRIVFRIGLCCGRIMADREDIYGHHVNIAARLQTIAPPGGIAMCSDMAALVQDAIPVPLEDLGMQHFRNMCRPVRAFQCRFLDCGSHELSENG